MTLLGCSSRGKKDSSRMERKSSFRGGFFLLLWGVFQGEGVGKKTITTKTIKNNRVGEGKLSPSHSF